MNCLDIYLRSTDKDGRVTRTTHRVWDVDRFMAARAKDVESVGGEASVTRITHEAFIAAQPKRPS